MLHLLDRVVDKVVPRAEAGACIPPEPCGCAWKNEYRCYHGLYQQLARSGGNSNCLGNCTYNGSICNYRSIRFC